MLRDLTISRKLTWLNVLVSAAALAVACSAFLAYDQVTYRNSLIHNVSTEAQVVGLNSISALVFNDPESASNSLHSLRGSPNVLAASIFRSDGTLFATYAINPAFRVSSKPFSPANKDQYFFADGQILITHPIYFGDKPVGTLVVRATTAELRNRLRQYLLIALGVLVLSLLAALLVSSAFRRGVAAPIVRLAETARVVSRDKNYAVRAVPTGNRDETAILIDAFNEMLSQIQVREAALESERARLGAIVDNAPVGIVLAEAPSGRIILGNRKTEEILGHPLLPTPDLASYSRWSTRHADGRPLEPHEHPLGRAVATGEVIRSEEYQYHRPDGRITWIRASAAPVRDKRGNIVAGVLVFSDIDEQKQAQDALLRSEKLAAAGRLAASISHEINNPLESVTNLLYLALHDPSLPPGAKEYLRQAEQELARVSQITTQTLRFYRQTTNPTSADISALLESVLRLLRGRLANREVEIEKQFRAQQPLMCFEGELRQVFTNLISNAVDAMPRQSGRLIVRTRDAQRWDTHQVGVRVLIADNGNGITREALTRIFEPFYSTKGSQGTGLGLWVSKEIVAKHHGTMRVKSAVGKGTVFSVFLPLQQTATRRDATAEGIGA
jgi:PAS domain S-box-containing protein